jgi:hypothetical protein
LQATELTPPAGDNARLWKSNGPPGSGKAILKTGGATADSRLDELAQLFGVADEDNLP